MLAGAYEHDGFYLRLSTIGLGYVSNFGHGPAGSASVSGLGLGLTYAVGGTLGGGFVLGGAMHIAVGGGTFHGAPANAPGSAVGGLLQIGALADWYPDPRDGWHVGSIIGFSALGPTDSANRAYDGTAPAFSLVGGYDGWIGPQWSLGFLLVGSFAPSVATTNGTTPTGYDFGAASLTVEASFVYN